MKTFTLFAAALATALIIQAADAPDLTAQLAAAEKREAAAKAALDAANARCRQESANRKEGEFRFCNQFSEQAEYMEANVAADRLRFQKLERDHAERMAKFNSDMATLNARKAEATARFCASAEKALKAPDITVAQHKALVGAMTGLCDKPKQQ